MASEPRVKIKTTIELYGTSVNLGTLADIIRQFTRDQTVYIRYSPGDPRDQRERDTVTLEIGG